MNDDLVGIINDFCVLAEKRAAEKKRECMAIGCKKEALYYGVPVALEKDGKIFTMTFYFCQEHLDKVMGYYERHEDEESIGVNIYALRTETIANALNDKVIK
jgi:hypothetical protein